MREKRKCEWCQQEFVPRKKTSRYCGNDCYIAHREQKSIEWVECGTCGETFSAKKRERRKYCTMSCAAVKNNTIYPKRTASSPVCKLETCDLPAHTRRSYCSEHKTNYAEQNRQLKVGKWLDGNDPGGTQFGLSKTIRAYLLEQSNYTCTKCGFNTPHPDDNKTILEINHINGDGTDHSKENLEVICPNCHALTSNYRARNMGKGRPHYYLRVSKA